MMMTAVMSSTTPSSSCSHLAQALSTSCGQAGRGRGAGRGGRGEVDLLEKAAGQQGCLCVDVVGSQALPALCWQADMYALSGDGIT